MRTSKSPMAVSVNDADKTNKPYTSRTNIRERILRAVRASLIDQIIPDLSNGDAVTSGHVAVTLMDYLLSIEGDEITGADLAKLEQEMIENVTSGGAPSHARLRAFAR